MRWGLPQDGEILEPRRAVLASIKQMYAVREAVGDDIELTFDVHTRLDLPDALWLCREVEAARPYFIEDPLRSENPDSFKTLRPRTQVPLAAGEQFNSKWEFRQLIEEEWIDYARIDLCIAAASGRTESKVEVVRNPLHQAGGAQSAGAGLLGGVPATQPCDAQLRRAGAAAQDRRGVDRRRTCAAGMARPAICSPPTLPGLGVEFDREAAQSTPSI